MQIYRYRERKWERMTRDRRRREQASSSSLRTITTKQLSSSRYDPFNEASHIRKRRVSHHQNEEPDEKKEKKTREHSHKYIEPF